jgi:hypothetical protein
MSEENTAEVDPSVTVLDRIEELKMKLEVMYRDMEELDEAYRTKIVALHDAADKTTVNLVFPDGSNATIVSEDKSIGEKLTALARQDSLTHGLKTWKEANAETAESVFDKYWWGRLSKTYDANAPKAVRDLDPELPRIFEIAIIRHFLENEVGYSYVLHHILDHYQKAYRGLYSSSRASARAAMGLWAVRSVRVLCLGPGGRVVVSSGESQNSEDVAVPGLAGVASLRRRRPDYAPGAGLAKVPPADAVQSAFKT